MKIRNGFLKIVVFASAAMLITTAAWANGGHGRHGSDHMDSGEHQSWQPSAYQQQHDPDDQNGRHGEDDRYRHEDGTGNGRHGHAPNFRDGLGPQQYSFDVDIADDVFVNQNRFQRLTGGMEFIDENGDGITDHVQDTDAFKSLNIGPFVDENQDGIHDAFQTRGAYRAMGMDNFVDVDGDGLCDNYEANPLDE